MGNFGPTCSQKSFAHSICWKHLVEAVDNEVMPLCCFPFQKKLLWITVSKLGWGDQTTFCSTNFNTLWVYHYKLWYLDI
jgi:hypothetical protein